MENVHTYQTDGDYAPILVMYKDEILMTGDTEHETYFDEYANGYADALNVKVESHWIEDSADLETHKEALKNAGMYDRFKNRLG